MDQLPILAVLLGQAQAVVVAVQTAAAVLRVVLVETAANLAAAVVAAVQVPRVAVLAAAVVPAKYGS
jgi:hypothetical protein